MKATYANDTEKGAGHGFFLVSEPGQFAMQDALRFSLRRASDQKCLGSGGWQPAEVFLAPTALAMRGEALCLAVDAGVVDNLDTQETYRLTLAGDSDLRAACGLAVSQVAYSPLSGGQGVGATLAPAPKPAAPPPPPMPEPEPEPLPDIMPETQTAPPPLEEEPASKGWIIPVILLLVLLAGGGFAFWKFYLQERLGQTNSTPVAQANATVPASPAPAEPAKAAPSEPVKEIPIAQARKQLSGAAQPAESLRLAKELAKEKDSADAVFLLVEDAAQKNNIDAMLMVADFYDPLGAKDTGSIKKDPRQAWDWYTKAKAAGAAEADEKLAALRDWAEKTGRKNELP